MSKIYIKGKENKIYIGGNLVTSFNDLPSNLEIHLEGVENTVFIPENFSKDSFLSVRIFGEKNTFSIQSTKKVCLSADMGYVDDPIKGSSFSLGEETSCNFARIVMGEDGSKISIGAHNFISWDVELWCTDGHSLIDKTSGNVLNVGKFIRIADSCWITRGVKIGKNTDIPSFCTLGCYSVVSGRFTESYCVIAGIPARVVKRNVKPQLRSVNSICGSGRSLEEIISSSSGEYQNLYYHQRTWKKSILRLFINCIPVGHIRKKLRNRL